MKESLKECRRSTCNSWSRDSSLFCVWRREASVEARGGLFVKCNTLQCMRKVNSDFLVKALPLSAKLFLGLFFFCPVCARAQTHLDSCLILLCFFSSFVFLSLVVHVLVTMSKIPFNFLLILYISTHIVQTWESLCIVFCNDFGMYKTTPGVIKMCLSSTLSPSVSM